MSIFEAITADSEQHGRETAHLQAEVPASTTDWTDATTWKVPADGTVTKLSVWHVPGSENALQTKPVRKVGNGANPRQPLTEFADDGEEFITGEPDGSDPYLMDEPVSSDDEIVVEAKNTNANNAYRFIVKVTVDYAGGTRRFLGGGS